MSPALEDDLRDALRAYTADLTSSPGLTRAVHRGGARRRLRRRVTLAVAPVLAAAALVGGYAMVPRNEPPSPETVAAALPARDQDLLDRPTGGDLAGDAGYLAAVREAWDGSHGRSINEDRGIFEHLLGAPRVVWAGRTPAGPAAWVVQVSDLRRHDDIQLEREGPALVWGFVGPGADGAPTVVADGYPVPGAPSLGGAFVDPGRTVLLVGDRGLGRAEVSWDLTYTDDGRASRRWLRAPFADGVAVVRVPAGADPADARLRFARDSGDLGNTGADPIAGVPSPDLRQWQDADGLAVFPVGGEPDRAGGGALADGDAPEDVLNAALTGRLPQDWPDVAQVVYGFWNAVGRTPDGSTLVAGERVLDRDPSRVYAVLRGPNGTVRVVAGPTYPDRAVPIDLELPDRQGRLVAAKGRTFTWTEGAAARSARDAALVPVGAADLRADGSPVG